MNDQVQQMMALARSQQAPNRNQGVDVGACGPNMMGAYPYNQFSQGCSVGPTVPQEALVRDGAIYQQCFVPLGIRFGVDNAGNIYDASQIGAEVGASGVNPIGNVYQLFPRVGTFTIFGVKFFNDPGVAEITAIQASDNDTNQILSPTDTAAWNTDDCFCPVNWGCVSTTSPLRIAARAVTQEQTPTVQAVNGAAWGIRTQSFGTCGPYGPAYGMPVPGM